MKVEGLLLSWFRAHVYRMNGKLIAKDLVHHLFIFLVPLFSLEDGLAPPVPPLSSGSIINFVVVLVLDFLGNFLQFVAREMVNGQ